MNFEDFENVPLPAPEPAPLAQADITASFEPLADAYAVPDAAEPDIFSGDHAGIADAAKELERRRGTEERPTIDRSYLDVQTGERSSPQATVSPERAADDLSRIRDAERAALEDAATAEVAAEVDALRAGVTPEQPPRQPTLESQPALEAQPEAVPEQPGESRLGRMLREDPELRTQVQNFVADVQAHGQAAAAQYEQQRQQMEAAYIQRANANTLEVQALLQILVPEIAGAQDASEIKGRLSMLQTTNPQRYAQIQSIMTQANAAVTNQQSYQQQVQVVQAQQAAAARQQYEQNFKAWAEQQDNLFDESVRHESPAAMKEVRSRVPEVLEKTYGIDMKELTQLYNSQPWLRSVAGQRLMMDAVRYQMAREGVSHARANPVAAVQRPGGSESIPRDENGRFSNASREFAANPNPSARDAANYLIAKRAARGGR